MSQARVRCANSTCGELFPQRTGPGRRKDYCSPACRRKAQRLRDAVPYTPLPGVPTGREAAQEVIAAAVWLLHTESSAAPLGERLAGAHLLDAALRRYVPAAVHQARQAGMDWTAVAAAAQVSTAAARGRWNAARVVRGTAGSERAAAPDGTPQVPGESDRARGRLTAALAFLHRVSGLSAQHLADRSGLEPFAAAQVLSGERLPYWPELGLIVSLLGGHPAELRTLWEQATGQIAAAGETRAPVEALHHAVRGLYLAAATPPPEEISALTRGRLTVDAVTAVLHGAVVPDWDTTHLLLTSLAADPAGYRRLWQAAHRSVAAPPGSR